MKTGRPLMRFADNRHDEWTAQAELEAGRWLRAGFHPDQLHPATGMPLEGALDRVDAGGDPSVAETWLRSSDELLERRRCRSLLTRGVVAAAVLVAAVGAAWIGGVL